MMVFKQKFEDYTEAEFLELLKALYEERNDLSEDAFDEFLTKGVLHVEAVTEHPEGIHGFYPSEDLDKSTPEKLLVAVIEWRAANNKPGFKPE
jgi:hypothetical protein